MAYQIFFTNSSGQSFQSIEYSGKFFVDNAHYIDQWFDADKFDWSYCWLLPQYCAEYFDIWYCPVKYHWRSCSHEMARWCTDRFDDWFEPDLYDNRRPDTLLQYCMHKIDIWYPHFKQYYAPATKLELMTRDLYS